MRVILLGTGAALPDPDRAQTSILVTLSSGAHYLFDCGHGATRNMVRVDVNPADVGWVFFTHLHYDHIIDFPYFILSSWILNRSGAPLVLGPAGTADFVSHLFEKGAFRVDLQARSTYPLRQKNLEALRPTVREVSPGVVFENDEIRVTAEYVEHIPREISECYGVRIEADGKVLAFSGDTKPVAAMVDLARNADLLIHECTFPQTFIEHRRKSGVGTLAHTSPTELGNIASQAGVKQLVVTHIGHFDSSSPVLKRAAKDHLPVDFMGPHLWDEVVRDIRQNYSGQLHLAHDLMQIDL